MVGMQIGIFGEGPDANHLAEWLVDHGAKVVVAPHEAPVGAPAADEPSGQRSLFDGCELVIVTEPQRPEQAFHILERLEAIVAANAVLGFSLPEYKLSELQTRAAHPKRLVGLRTWLETGNGRVIELIDSGRTGPELAWRAWEILSQSGALCIRVSDAEDGIVARLLAALIGEAVSLVTSGLVGEGELDEIGKRLFSTWEGPCELNRSCGLFDVPAPAVRRSPGSSSAEIEARLLGAVWLEAGKLLAEHRAVADDIDCAMCFGLGWGVGPFECARRRGRETCAAMTSFVAERRQDPLPSCFDPRGWALQVAVPSNGAVVPMASPLEPHPVLSLTVVRRADVVRSRLEVCGECPAEIPVAPLPSSRWTGHRSIPLLAVSVMTVDILAPQLGPRAKCLLMWAAINVSQLLMIMALRLHRQGIAERRRKYGLIIIAVLLVAHSVAWLLVRDSLLLVSLFYCLGSVPIGWLMAHLLLNVFRARPWMLYRWIVGFSGSVGGAFLFIPSLAAIWYVQCAAMAYAFTRFLVVEQLAKRPILYCRSYGDPGAGDAYAHVVSPAAERFGVVAAVGSEWGEELTLMATVGAWPRVSRPGLDTWRQEVSALLERCVVVVIDLGSGTPGVLWELEEARARLGADRIAVLHRSEVADPASKLEGMWRLPYSLDSLDLAEPRLREWLRLRIANS